MAIKYYFKNILAKNWDETFLRKCVKTVTKCVSYYVKNVHKNILFLNVHQDKLTPPKSQLRLYSKHFIFFGT